MNKVNYDMVLNNETSTSNPIMTCKISPESRFLAVGDARGKLNIYEIDVQKKIALATQVLTLLCRSRPTKCTTTG